MAKSSQLLDRWGNPVRRSDLSAGLEKVKWGGARSPISGTPADGLDPERLAAILREADHGDGLRYLELAELIEERDPHYLAVLNTRRRSVSQLEITVEPASESPADLKVADMIRDWLKRDELSEEIFQILDAIGKGFSFTWIDWDTSTGHYWPRQLTRYDQRWCRFDRNDLTTPLMLDEFGAERPLEPFRFIYADMPAKSGIPLRSGLARVAAWGWMFKAYTQRDWAIFTQTYGQPLRIGKYEHGSTQTDRDTLFDAVANIAGDCAAIIPQEMTIDFIEAKNVGSASGLYKERSDWLDQQISKAVLGQTATTDAVTGGLGSGKEHRQVQEDIERADARMLAAILNRDLIRPWIDLEYGPQARYPRLKIGRPEEEDVAATVAALGVLVPLGFRVAQAPLYQKLGLPEPKATDQLLVATPQQPSPPPVPNGNAAQSAVKYPLNTLGEFSGTMTALQAEGPSVAKKTGGSPVEGLTDRLVDQTAPALRSVLGKIDAMLQSATDLDEFEAMLLQAYPTLDMSAIASTLELALEAAHLGGEVAAAEEGRD